jgi:hypothetical protein
VRISLHVFGTEVLALNLGDEHVAEEVDEPGDCTTYPLGFTASHGDQRWSEVEAPGGGEL